jgi:hypothetical protein
MTDDWSRVAANAIAHEAQMTAAAWQAAASSAERPSVLYRPTLSVDGGQWCVLLGDDLASGLAAFGGTVADAMYAFDLAFASERAPAACLAAKQEQQP